MTYPPMPAPAWVWRAKLLSVTDGDTVRLQLDLGFSDYGNRDIRLDGLNAAEHGTPEGDAATAWVGAWFPLHTHTADWPLIVSISKTPDKYAPRWDGVVYCSDGACLNAQLIAAGHAVPWDGRGKKPVPPGAVPGA